MRRLHNDTFECHAESTLSDCTVIRPRKLLDASTKDSERNSKDVLAIEIVMPLIVNVVRMSLIDDTYVRQHNDKLTFAHKTVRGQKVACALKHVTEARKQRLISHR